MPYTTRTLLHGGDHEVGEGEYTMPVVGIFVILVLGLVGSLVPPLVGVYMPKFDLNSRYGFRFFNGLAAGVVLGVGYIHSIPDALESFEAAFEGKEGKSYEYAWGGFLAMVGSLLTFICEEFVHRRIGRFAALHGHDHGDGHSHSHSGHSSNTHAHAHAHKHAHDRKHSHSHPHNHNHSLPDYTPATPTDCHPHDDSGSSSSDSNSRGSTEVSRALEEGTRPPHSPSSASSDHSVSTTSTTPIQPNGGVDCGHPVVSIEASKAKDLDVVVATFQEEEEIAMKQGITEEQLGYYTELYVLLFGLTFHSLFVGIALGVSGNDWGLFAAIIFHQFFEGLALGARVARAGFKKKIHIWLLDIVYALAIPVGIAIGIGIQSAIVDEPMSYNVVNGVFQGLSAGVLIYVALIHMMKEEMTRPEFKKGGPLLYVMYSGFLIGAGCMAVIGIWA